MTLRDTLQTDLVAAMKAGDDVKKTTLRAVITAVKTGETAEGVDGELDDSAIMKLIATEIKQRNEAAEIFEDAGEAERAAKEIAERDVLQAYLPEPLSAEELDALVSSVIADGGYTTKKDMGSAIKDVMARADGRVDGKTVSQAVGRSLA
ncbi:MAG: GatB/YqeY domain-containing protein [Acidimicrobiia bacterium]|nr:GatB/YqeY domain-containing protein [Acidimicrobiia bacterium]